MKLLLLIETLRHLTLTQVLYQVRHKLIKPQLGAEKHPPVKFLTTMASAIVKPRCYEGGGKFTFLNITDEFRGWQMQEHGALWTYNLNYMDWLEQDGMSEEEALAWIDRYINDLPGNRVGQDPYPTALRLINWVKFFTRHPQLRTQERMDSMFAQTRLLQRSLEYHLMGNHLLEDAYALFICSVFFCDQSLFEKAKTLLLSQLEEQILPDGAHYEQSSMYHCILLDRLLDCINFSTNNLFFSHQEAFNEQMKGYAGRMLGHLNAIRYKDESLPLMNDAAEGIAPTVRQLFDYAQRLNVSWEKMPMGACGYRRLTLGEWEVTVDVGNITAVHQPGHSHADTFNFELRVGGAPIVVDTGVSTYNKNERRQYERSTAAHNTVTINGQDSSRVWGGFRVGKRARVTLFKDEPFEVMARHDGFGRAIHQRRFLLGEDTFVVEDLVLCSGEAAVCRLYLAPGLHARQVADGELAVGTLTVAFEGYQRIEIQHDDVSVEYNRLQDCEVICVTFVRWLSTLWKR